MKRVIVTRPACWKTVAVVVALGAGLLVAACSSSSTTSGGASTPPTSAAASSPASSPSANGALCADAAALRASLHNLTSISVGSGAASDIKTNLADVQSKLNTLTAHARGQWHTQTSALKASLDKLKTATSKLAASPSVSAVSDVVTAMGGVTASASNLLAAISTDCPSASPSAST
jgi:hypothetical protein